MKLNAIFSLDSLTAKMRGIVLRFPITCLLAVLGTMSAWYLTYQMEDAGVTKFLLMCIVGFFWSLTIALATEEHRRAKQIYLYVLLGLALVGYFFLLPGQVQDFREPDVIRILVLVATAILGIMAAPFLRGEKINLVKNSVSNGVNAFWHYNRKLYTRLAFTFISTGVLYLGLVLPLTSINYLFGLNVAGEWFFRIWILVAGLISTSVFLTGVPVRPGDLESETDYPKVIQVFAMYVLVPLLVLYTVILYMYGAKILVTQTWPKGQVSSLVLAFAVVGVATTFLLYAEWQKGDRLARLVRYFYASLIPLLGLLFGAIGVRVSEYGLTESRVSVIVAGVWLLGLSIYFLWHRARDIRVIPISLAVVALLVVFGPINIFSVSRASQVGRLENLLVANNILVQGRIQEVNSDLLAGTSFRDIYSLVQYLDQTGSLGEMNKWFGMDVNKLSDNRYLRLQQIMERMGLKQL